MCVALATLYLQRRDERRAGKLRLTDSDSATSRAGNEDEYDDPDGDIKKDVDEVAVVEVLNTPVTEHLIT